ncbi:MAG: MFS transporter [Desulfosudis oleivorans]|nr:MFS transporter [Desulfosudis oleivorans]
MLGRPSHLLVSPGIDDQHFVVLDGGIGDCVLYGPGVLKAAHAPDEYVPVDDLVSAAKQSWLSPRWISWAAKPDTSRRAVLSCRAKGGCDARSGRAEGKAQFSHLPCGLGPVQPRPCAGEPLDRPARPRAGAHALHSHDRDRGGYQVGGVVCPQIFVAWSLSGRAISRTRMVVLFIFSRLSLALIAPLILLAGRQRPDLCPRGAVRALHGVLRRRRLRVAALVRRFHSVAFADQPLQADRERAGAGRGGGNPLQPRGWRGFSPGPCRLFRLVFDTFAAAGGFMALELVAISFLRVVPDDHGRQRIPLRAFLPRLAGLLARDRDFRRLILVRLLVGASGLSLPFYIVFGFDVLHLGPQSVGVFTGAQVVGGIASAPLMALLSEKRGTRSVIRLVAILSLLLPLLGLCLFSEGCARDELLLGLSAAIFFLMGGVNNGNMAGFNNYLLEHAPSVQRAVYVGLANTLVGLSWWHP